LTSRKGKSFKKRAWGDAGKRKKNSRRRRVRAPGTKKKNGRGPRKRKIVKGAGGGTYNPTKSMTLRNERGEAENNGETTTMRDQIGKRCLGLGPGGGEGWVTPWGHPLVNKNTSLGKAKKSLKVGKKRL